MQPPVFLTVVSASRRPSPVAALFVPRSHEGAPREKPPEDAPRWLVELNDAYDAGCAPREAFRTLMDEETARLLMGLGETEIEVVPGAVNVQRHEALFDGSRVVPLLDAAERLVRRLDAVAERLAGTSEEDAAIRAQQVREFLHAFKR